MKVRSKHGCICDLDLAGFNEMMSVILIECLTMGMSLSLISYTKLGNSGSDSMADGLTNSSIDRCRHKLDPKAAMFNVRLDSHLC